MFEWDVMIPIEVSCTEIVTMEIVTMDLNFYSGHEWVMNKQTS